MTMLRRLVELVMSGSGVGVRGGSMAWKSAASSLHLRRVMDTEVPRPSWLSKVMLPSIFLIRSREMAKPRPVPRPTAFVVKNGSKTRRRFSGAMPLPLSTMRRLISSSRRSTKISIRPSEVPGEKLCAALRSRFSNTCRS